MLAADLAMPQDEVIIRVAPDSQPLPPNRKFLLVEVATENSESRLNFFLHHCVLPCPNSALFITVLNIRLLCRGTARRAPTGIIAASDDF
jgi:hypothetical protein